MFPGWLKACELNMKLMFDTYEKVFSKQTQVG